MRTQQIATLLQEQDSGWVDPTTNGFEGTARLQNYLNSQSFRDANPAVGHSVPDGN
ncbi:hypothetical protein P4S72_14600 [Vibrio sp. PP-XX7]